MAHKFKTASNGQIYCSKCGCSSYQGDQHCNEKGHSFTMQKTYVFCTKCGKIVGFPDVLGFKYVTFSPVSEYAKCSDKGHKYKVFPDREIRCTKCGRSKESSYLSCSN